MKTNLEIEIVLVPTVISNQASLDLAIYHGVSLYNDPVMEVSMKFSDSLAMLWDSDVIDPHGEYPQITLKAKQDLLEIINTFSKELNKFKKKLDKLDVI